jgi:DNA-directed RNA polymerase specialized sigma24 family protein
MASLDLETLRRAQKLRRDAVEQVLNESFPAIVRIAHAVTGRDDAGAEIVRSVVRRGLRQLPRFRDEGEPQRWFLRHTILACRSERRRPVGPGNDLLVALAPPPDASSPAYRAFVSGLRKLPEQQVEAFLLRHGEAFNPRYTALAMDCSIAAAETHLAAAIDALRPIAGGDDALASHTRGVRAAYQALSPAEQVSVPRVSRVVRGHIWPRRLWRAGKFVVLASILGIAAWFCWKILPAIEY